MKTVFALLAVVALVCGAGVVQASGHGFDHQNLVEVGDDGSVPYGAEDKHNYGAVGKHNYGADSGMQLGGKGCPFNYMDGDKV